MGDCALAALRAFRAAVYACFGRRHAALRQGQLDVEALRRVLHRFAPRDGPAVYAVDVSAWPRCDASTSPERAFHYSATRHLSGEPVVSGWAYQWIMQVRLTLWPDGAERVLAEVHPHGAWVRWTGA